MTDLGALGPPPPRVHPDALLGPRSVAAGLMLNPLTLLGGPRALLLQIAHPLVAAGVWDHSDFRRAPFDRLLRTLAGLATVAFADPGASRRALDHLASIHQGVRGRSPSGRAYAGGDPRLATWVHATIVDSYIVVHRRWIGHLSPAKAASFYVETLPLGQAFGARFGPSGGDSLPTGLGAFDAWMRERLEALEVSEQARLMAPDILHPPLSQPWGAPGRLAERLAWPFMEAITADLLPARLCRAYGLAEPRSRNRPTRAAMAGARVATRGASPLIRRFEAHPDRPTRVAAALTGQSV